MSAHESPNAATDDAIAEARDEGFATGARVAWRRVLEKAIVEMCGYGGLGDPLVTIAKLQNELEEVRASLREVCRDHGDNDWDDDLNLSDVIEKHLAPYLEAEEE